MKTVLQNPNNQSGLTLLELLLVVTILSATAMMATFMVSDDTSQYRLKETENKLTALKKAIVSVNDYNGMYAVSGYVADNGKLPECIQDLWDKGVCSGSSLADYGAVTPYYNASASDSGGNSVGVTSTLNPLSTLYKGFRPVYLQQIQQSGANTFRDGWANDVNSSNTACTTPSGAYDAYDSTNQGWCFSNDSGDLTVTSYGRDNQVGSSVGSSVYDGDSVLNLDKSEWNVDFLQVTIKNTTTNAIPSSLPTPPASIPAEYDLRLALVSYKNGSDWQQVTQSLAINQLSVDDEITVTITPDDGITAGRHVLVLFNSVSGNQVENERQIEIYPNVNNSIRWSIR